MQLDPAVLIPRMLGSALAALEERRLDECVRLCEEVLRVEPGHPGALEVGGIAEYTAGRWGNAEALLRRATAAAPDSPEAWGHLGQTRRNLGRSGEALGAFGRASRLRPEAPEYRVAVGNALSDLGRHAEAADVFEGVTHLTPEEPRLWVLLGNARYVLQHVTQAERAYRRALELVPDDLRVRNQLGNLLVRTGRVEEGLALFIRSHELRGLAKGDLNPQLSQLQYGGRLSPEEVFEEHRAWGQALEEAAGPVPVHANDRTPDRVLRVGYVSGDFRDHAVWKWFEPILEHRDRSKFKVVLYANDPRPDAVTGKAKSYADEWRDTSDVDDEAMKRLIMEDRIDVLVDLSNQTPRNRLRMFARKPAPVQATYLGTPGTSGLSRMDYLIIDPHVAPPGMTEHLNTEKLVRLPHCFGAWRPPQAAPEVNELPAGKNGFVTFGSFNFLAKLSAETLEMWSRVLRATPGSRLLIKSWGAGDEGVRTRLREAIAKGGVGPERIETLGHASTQEDHLATYGRVDVALDTFPYHGTTTTCDAMWMGVPVVTLAGKAHVSRTGVSLLKNVGLDELIAESEGQYVKIASGLASDLPRLVGLRRTLRDRMARSRLTDGKALAADFERALRWMWEEYCR